MRVKEKKGTSGEDEDTLDDVDWERDRERTGAFCAFILCAVSRCRNLGLVAKSLRSSSVESSPSRASSNAGDSEPDRSVGSFFGDSGATRVVVSLPLPTSPSVKEMMCMSSVNAESSFGEGVLGRARRSATGAPDGPTISSGNATSFIILRPHVSALSSDSPTHVISADSTLTSQVDGECECERTELERPLGDGKPVAGSGSGVPSVRASSSGDNTVCCGACTSREREPELNELLEVPVVLLLERVNTIPPSVSILFRPEPVRECSSNGLTEISSSPAGDSSGDVKAETCAVRFIGSDRYRSNPAEPRRDMTSARRPSLTCERNDVSVLGESGVY